MNPSETSCREQELAALLATYDEAQAGGRFPQPATSVGVGFDSDCSGLLASPAVLQMMNRVWPLAALPDQAADKNTRCPVRRPLTQLGPFLVEDEVGRGGCGIVFRALDARADRVVALKVPRPDLLASPELNGRFLLEAQAAARLHHPNIVPCYEWGQFDTICYISFAFCKGPTLASWLSRQAEPIAERAAAALVAAIADGAQHAHERGVLHRDIKPSNVLLNVNDWRSGTNMGAGEKLPFVPRLTDFGLARLDEDRELTDKQSPIFEWSTSSTAGVIAGTSAYMAPEQASGRTHMISARSDVHALGVILYETLTGHPPFEGRSRQEILERVKKAAPIPPRNLRPGLSSRLDSICSKCLEKQPADRYKSAAALAADLRLFLAGSAPKWA
jgi:serine/threonine protein kinase